MTVNLCNIYQWKQQYRRIKYRKIKLFLQYFIFLLQQFQYLTFMKMEQDFVVRDLISSHFWLKKVVKWIFFVYINILILLNIKIRTNAVQSYADMEGITWITAASLPSILILLTRKQLCSRKYKQILEIF